MNVLHIVPSFFPAWRQGGPSESVYRLCRSLAERGCFVRVLTTDSHGLGQVLEVEKDQELIMADFLSVRYCRRMIQDSVSPALLKCLPSYIRWADVVHLTAVYSFPTIPALFLSKLYKKPVIWSPRGSLQKWEKSSKLKLKAIWNQVCWLLGPKKLVFHVTSEEEAEESRNSLPGINTVIIPNGVDVPRQVNHVPRQGILRLGYLGRLDPKKGLENLLMACETFVPKKKIPFSLTIGGTGSSSYTQIITNMIIKLGLSSYVNMIGQVEPCGKAHFFENIDILIMPSYTENFGLVVAESLAHGIPVIASKGTPWKRLEKMACGLWVENDSCSLANAIEQINKMPLPNMGQRGRYWMSREFSWESVGESMIQTYKQLTEIPVFQ